MASPLENAGLITRPTLIVRGALSDVSHDDETEVLEKQIPPANVVWIDEAGHTVPGDQTSAFAKDLEEFCRSIIDRRSR